MLVRRLYSQYHRMISKREIKKRSILQNAKLYAKKLPKTKECTSVQKALQNTVWTLSSVLLVRKQAEKKHLLPAGLTPAEADPIRGYRRNARPGHQKYYQNCTCVGFWLRKHQNGQFCQVRTEKNHNRNKVLWNKGNNSIPAFWKAECHKKITNCLKKWPIFASFLVINDC